MPVIGRFYSPFAYSLSDPRHPAEAEVRKARLSHPYKSMTYMRTNQSVFCGIGRLGEFKAKFHHRISFEQ
jgi:hypothetical protein